MPRLVSVSSAQPGTGDGADGEVALTADENAQTRKMSLAAEECERELRLSYGESNDDLRHLQMGVDQWFLETALHGSGMRC